MDWLVAGGVVAAAAGFRGITGFGYALIAALGLGAVLQPSAMVPLVLIGDLVLTGLILMNRNIGAVDWPAARLLLVTGLAGALVGSLLAGMLDEATSMLLVSLITCASALVAFAHHPPRWLAGRAFGVANGFFGGVMLAAFAVGGPLIAAWLLAGGTEREKTRGTLAVYFGAVDLLSIVSRVALGQVSADLPRQLLLTLPLTLAGYYAGLYASRRMSHMVWRRFSILGLVAIALAGAFQTFQYLFA